MNLKKVYKQIANRHGVSVSEVKREMQAAIDEAYGNPNWFARCVYCVGDKPTLEEFVSHVARRIQKRCR